MDLPSPPLVETIGITRGAGWLTPIDVDLANLCMFYTRIYQFACKRLNYIYFNNFATSAGIENPRVLGSIPSPGTIFRRTRLWRVFRFSGIGLSIELRSIIRPRASPCGPALKRCSTRRQRRLSESGHHIQKNPPMAGFSLSGVRASPSRRYPFSHRHSVLSTIDSCRVNRLFLMRLACCKNE